VTDHKHLYTAVVVERKAWITLVQNPDARFPTAEDWLKNYNVSQKEGEEQCTKNGQPSTNNFDSRRFTADDSNC
jgi:hypothetical protein